MTEAEFVIVGAGSAGCALANRLAEAGRTVLVIEQTRIETDQGKLVAVVTQTQMIL